MKFLISSAVTLLLVQIFCAEIEVLGTSKCDFSNALRILFDYAQVKYKFIDAVENPKWIEKDKKVPRVYVDKRLIGGYRATLMNYRMFMPSLPDTLENLNDPEYVLKNKAKFTRRPANFANNVYK